MNKWMKGWINEWKDELMNEWLFITEYRWMDKPKV